ncbi:MAG TPA: hypothetical protein O0X79_02190 [Methanocorpusculum sp.]|jgi:hypothetical protein|nr:hypothetical protein [Methanocorpusculum sp.]
MRAGNKKGSFLIFQDISRLTAEHPADDFERRKPDSSELAGLDFGWDLRGAILTEKTEVLFLRNISDKERVDDREEHTYQ